MTTPRPATADDLPGIRAIINHYITHTSINFKSVPLTGAEATEWLGHFAPENKQGRYRLFVTAAHDTITGFACTAPFILRDAYDTTVMASVYLHPDHTRNGRGTALYSTLFDAIKDEDIHRIAAGITQPNPGSVALHRKFSFTDVGVFTAAGRKFGKFHDVLWMERPLHLQ